MLIRAFIALELSEQARDYFWRIQLRLDRVGADIRWVLPENLHLTLVFLGNINSEKIPKLAEALDRATSDMEIFQLAPGRFGFFGAMGRPRVLWASVDGDLNALATLASAVRQAASMQGMQIDSRPFSPHLTIGRVKSKRQAVEFARALADIKINPTPTFFVDKINLMRSVLAYQGATHTLLHASLLGKKQIHI